MDSATTPSSLPSTITVAGQNYRKVNLLPTCSDGEKPHPITFRWYFSNHENDRCLTHPPMETGYPRDGKDLDGLYRLVRRYELAEHAEHEDDKSLEAQILASITEKHITNNQSETRLRNVDRPLDAALAKGVSWLIENKDWEATVSDASITFVPDWNEWEGGPVASISTQILTRGDEWLAMSALEDWELGRHPLRPWDTKDLTKAPSATAQRMSARRATAMLSYQGDTSKLASGLKKRRRDKFGGWEPMENPLLILYAAGQCANEDCPSKLKTFRDTETSVCYSALGKYFHTECLPKPNVTSGLQERKTGGSSGIDGGEGDEENV